MAKIVGVSGFNTVRAPELSMLDISLTNNRKSMAGLNDKATVSQVFVPSLLHLSLSVTGQGSISLDTLLTPKLRSLTVRTETSGASFFERTNFLSKFGELKESSWKWKVPNLATLELSNPASLSIFKFFKDFAFTNLVYLKLDLDNNDKDAIRNLERFDFPSLMKISLAYVGTNPITGNIHRTTEDNIHENLPLFSHTHQIPNFQTPILEHLQLSNLPKTTDLTHLSVLFPYIRTLTISNSQEVISYQSTFNNLENLRLLNVLLSDFRSFTTSEYPRLRSLQIKLLKGTAPSAKDSLILSSKFAPNLTHIKVQLEEPNVEIKTSQTENRISLSLTVIGLSRLVKIDSLSSGIQWTVENCPSLRFFKGIGSRHTANDHNITTEDFVLSCSDLNMLFVIDLNFKGPTQYENLIIDQRSMKPMNISQLNSMLIRFDFEKMDPKQWESYCRYVDSVFMEKVRPYFKKSTLELVEGENSVVKFIDSFGDYFEYISLADEALSNSSKMLKDQIRSKFSTKIENSVSEMPISE